MSFSVINNASTFSKLLYEGTKQQYINLQNKDSNALYFLSDIGEIYKGEIQYGGGSGSMLTGVLLASNWSNNTQTVTINGISSSSIGSIGLLNTATDQQIEAAGQAVITPIIVENNSITFTCENTPSIDIPFGVLMLNNNRGSEGRVPTLGFTPVGTVISVMGTTAPQHYLPCDGTIVNIADYPVLASYFEEQFGEVNFFGGDGETTFALPDLRGEFLRGTGTNSHANQGSGASVGVHQDGTGHANFFQNASNGDLIITVADNAGWMYPTDRDSELGTSTTARYNIQSVVGTTVDPTGLRYTSRPTNTSVLYCIATKNIYVDARYDYSLDEKVVGTWINGKPIYQKTFSGSWTVAANASVEIATFTGVDELINFEGTANVNDTNKKRCLSCCHGQVYLDYNKLGYYSIFSAVITTLTIQYTKA